MDHALQSAKQALGDQPVDRRIILPLLARRLACRVAAIAAARTSALVATSVWAGGRRAARVPTSAAVDVTAAGVGAVNAALAAAVADALEIAGGGAAVERTGTAVVAVALDGARSGRAAIDAVPTRAICLTEHVTGHTRRTHDPVLAFTVATGDEAAPHLVAVAGTELLADRLRARIVEGRVGGRVGADAVSRIGRHPRVTRERARRGSAWIECATKVSCHADQRGCSAQCPHDRQAATHH